MPEPYRMAYLEQDDGSGYWLSKAVAVVIEEGENTLARMRSEHAAWLRDSDAKRAAEKADWDRETVGLALTHHLTEAGVKPTHAKAAAALIAQTNRMVVQDDGLGRVVVASTPFGLRSVEGLVGDFLASEDGKPFLPAPAATVSTFFGDMVRDMRRDGR